MPSSHDLSHPISTAHMHAIWPPARAPFQGLSHARPSQCSCMRAHRMCGAAHMRPRHAPGSRVRVRSIPTAFACGRAPRIGYCYAPAPCVRFPWARAVLRVRAMCMGAKPGPVQYPSNVQQPRVVQHAGGICLQGLDAWAHFTCMGDGLQPLLLFPAQKNKRVLLGM